METKIAIRKRPDSIGMLFMGIGLDNLFWSPLANNRGIKKIASMIITSTRIS